VRRARWNTKSRANRSGDQGRQSWSITAPLGRRSGHHEGKCATRKTPRLPFIFPDPRPDAAGATDEWLAEVKSRVVELPLARKSSGSCAIRPARIRRPDIRWDVPLGNYLKGLPKNPEEPEIHANWVINNLRAKTRGGE